MDCGRDPGLVIFQHAERNQRLGIGSAVHAVIDKNAGDFYCERIAVTFANQVEHEIKGWRSTAGERVDSVEAALECAAALGYPVVLKALGITHKTELDAVRLNLSSAVGIEQAAGELFALSDQLYLEVMIPYLAELIVRVTREQPFGLVLTIGSGGVLVELMKDTRTLLIPARRDKIETAVRSLSSGALLEGYRGKPQADINSTVEAILAIQAYAISRSNWLIELEVNPLLVGAQGDGVFAADALIVLGDCRT